MTNRVDMYGSSIARHRACVVITTISLYGKEVKVFATEWEVPEVKNPRLVFRPEVSGLHLSQQQGGMLARWPKPIQAALHRPGELKGP